MYGNMYYPQQQVMQLIRVNGIEGARAYQMPPNSTAALFDTGNDLMYIRTTDGAGFPQIRVFSFTEVLDREKDASGDTSAIQKEIEQIKADIEEIKGVMNSGKQPIRKSKPDSAE